MLVILKLSIMVYMTMMWVIWLLLDAEGEVDEISIAGIRTVQG
jgi:hypothetical protein